MVRRGWRLAVAAAVAVAGCAGSDGIGSESSPPATGGAVTGGEAGGDGTVGDEVAAGDDVPAASPVDGYTSVRSFAELVGGYWAPTGTLGRPFVQRPGAFWEFEVRDGEPRISGHDGCNGFGFERGAEDPPAAFEDGRLVNVSVSHALQACENPGNGLYPEEGATFWIDEDGDHLVVSPDGGDAYVFFERLAAPPAAGTDSEAPGDDELAEAEGAAELDAEAARRHAEAAREQLRAALPIARERWAAAGLASYELRFETACLECASFPHGSGEAEVVTVVGGRADSPWNDAVIGATVDDWFEFLERRLDDAWVVAADFHPELGHPTAMRFVNREWTGPEQTPYQDWLTRDAVVAPTGAGAIPAASDGRIELRLDGIGPHAFGDPLGTVEATVAGALGPAEVLDQIPPLFTCIRWGCSQATVLHWPDAGLLVAFTDRRAGGGTWPDPRLAAWTVTAGAPRWPGEIAAPGPTGPGPTPPEVRLTTVNGIGLGSTVAELHAAFPATVDLAWTDSSFVPNGFHVPDRDGVAVLDGDLDWNPVTEIQAALAADGASLAVDGIAGPDTTAALTAFRQRTGHERPEAAFRALGVTTPSPDARVVRLSAGEWFWELDCGALEPFGIPNEC